MFEQCLVIVTPVVMSNSRLVTSENSAAATARSVAGGHPKGVAPQGAVALALGAHDLLAADSHMKPQGGKALGG